MQYGTQTCLVRRMIVSILLCAVGALMLSTTQAAKRDLSPFKGKFTGKASFVGDDVFTGPAVIRFKTKSRNRAADVKVAASITAEDTVLNTSVNYKLPRKGKATCSAITPGAFLGFPPSPAKYETRKRKITALFSSVLGSTPIFVRLTIHRRSTKKRAFLKINHEVLANSPENPPSIVYIYEGSRRLK